MSPNLSLMTSSTFNRATGEQSRQTLHEKRLAVVGTATRTSRPPRRSGALERLLTLHSIKHRPTETKEHLSIVGH